MWRQRANSNSIFKEITKIEQHQSITKDFLQDHIDKLIIDEKIINKINKDKDSYKVNIELIDEKDQSFRVSPNDFPPTSAITPINEKTPLIDFTFPEQDQKPQTNQ